MSQLELKGLQILRDLNLSAKKEDAFSERLINLPIDFLSPGKYQPRRRFDENILNELADSIKVQGIIQPIIVRKISDERYEIIAGERRWRAAKKVGFSSVPVIEKNIEDNIALAFSLIENIQRENLNPIEEAMAFARFRDEFHMTHMDIATMVGRS